MTYDLVQKEVHNEQTVELLPGNSYLEWLKWAHRTIKPANYVEIGVETGQSLQYVGSNTRAVGIDPAPQIVHGFSAWSKIYKAESDTFFKENNLVEVMHGAVNLAFIDGLHYYEQALRDFMHVEAACLPESVIMLHDVNPVIAETATRERNTYWWAGDTWKIMVILAKHRPDLKIITVPAFPTGLAIITGLDPASTYIKDHFDTLVKEVANMSFDDYLPINLINNDYDEALTELQSAWK
jgi:hypothetical protein